MIRKNFSLWVTVGGSISSLNIALSELFDTHVLVYTFSSAITLHFLLLHLSFIQGEFDHVSYMTYKSICSICKSKYSLVHICIMLTVQGSIPSCYYYLDSSIILYESLMSTFSYPVPIHSCDC